MALGSTGVIDVVALEAAPIFGSWHIVFESSSSSTSSVPIFSIPVVGFRLVAFFALVSEIKVQKIALGTVPLPVVVMVVPASVPAPVPTSVFAPRAGTGT